MKLHCEVETVDRIVKNLNGASCKRRSLKSTLALAKDPKVVNSFYILHFSSLVKAGVKYKVNENVMQIFSKFCNEGKCTIRFKTPPNDLYVKNCDPHQLQTFLTSMCCVLKGKEDELKQLTFASASTTSIKRPPTKLIIKNLSQYPKDGLSRTLEHLEWNDCALHSFRREILSLKCLKYLDMSNNRLQTLPKEVGTLPNLAYLNLSKNMLGNSDQSGWDWLLGPQISKKLTYLDLSENHLGPCLSNHITNLSKLVTMSLQNNQITALPDSISKMASLRHLNISHNSLKSLPGNVKLLNLEELDVSDNLMHEADLQDAASHNINLMNYYKVGSLVELCGAVVLNRNIFYTKGMIPLTLIHYLSSSKYCLCGKATFNDANCVVLKKRTKEMFRSVVFDHTSEETRLQCYFCSNNCFKSKHLFF